MSEAHAASPAAAAATAGRGGGQRGGRGFDADRKVKYGTELYNLKKDLSEKKNLADHMPDKVKSLQAKMQQVLEN